MIILNFDTSLDKTYITLSKNSEIIANKIIENADGKYHSAFLIPTLAEILKNAHLQINQVGLIATNLGPGSFTGIRACLVVARTFCQQANIKALGVSSLEILSKINTTDKKSLVVLDARKEMVYVEIIDKNFNIIKQPTAIYISELLELIKNDDYCIITDEKISKLLLENSIQSINYQENTYNLGLFLNKIAQEFYEKNKNFDYNWAKLRPLYIQPPPVSMPKAKV